MSRPPEVVATARTPLAGAARLALRLAAAALLTVLAVRLVGLERLQQQLRQAQLGWFAAAVLVAGAAQCVSVLRWGTIARIFGLRVRTRALAVAYAQGMTLNALLPGATLGGDTLRSLRLQALGNPLGESALTVLLDRLSGLWVLCVLSLGTTLGLLLHLGFSGVTAELGRVLPPSLRAFGTTGILAAYLAGLAAACTLPWLPIRPRAAAGGRTDGWGARVWARLCTLHDLARAQGRPLLRSIWSSVLVQVLCAITLWLCARAAGGPVGYWQVQAVAAPVFIAGALPLSYGGFGARELTALVAFPLVGAEADLGLMASALYGLEGIVLGLLVAPAFALRPAAPAVAGPGRQGL